MQFGCTMVELYIYLVCMGGYYVNFQNLSIDLVKVKFSECYSYASMNLRKIWNLLFDTLKLGFLIMPKSTFLSVIFGIGKYAYSNATKILW
jgi:ABC-type phosphate/phosphonate transport system permease subunit